MTWLQRFLAWFGRPPEPEEAEQLTPIPDGEDNPSPTQVARAAGCPFPLGDGWDIYRDDLGQWMRAKRLETRTSLQYSGGVEAFAYAGDYLICPAGQGRAFLTAAEFEARFRPWSPGDSA